jgi:hypothetical protein
MSPAMSWAEGLVMASVISASVAVMIALVFLAEHQSKSGRTRAGEQPGGKRRGPPKR